jgi:hypothetical protein
MCTAETVLTPVINQLDSSLQVPLSTTVAYRSTIFLRVSSQAFQEVADHLY